MQLTNMADSKQILAVSAPGAKPPVLLGTKERLPEFQLTNKVVLVSGAARGLELTQAEALLEAGAIGMDTLLPIFKQLPHTDISIVYALDRLEEPVSHESTTIPPRELPTKLAKISPKTSTECKSAPQRNSTLSFITDASTSVILRTLRESCRR